MRVIVAITTGQDYCKHQRRIRVAFGDRARQLAPLSRWQLPVLTSAGRRFDVQDAARVIVGLLHRG
jgi:hypothetical protein